jgi:hypothetical protein
MALSDDVRAEVLEVLSTAEAAARARNKKVGPSRDVPAMMEADRWHNTAGEMILARELLVSGDADSLEELLADLAAGARARRGSSALCASAEQPVTPADVMRPVGSLLRASSVSTRRPTGETCPVPDRKNSHSRRWANTWTIAFAPPSSSNPSCPDRMGGVTGHSSAIPVASAPRSDRLRPASTRNGHTK